MKKDFDKLNAPDPDTFWPEAENMLDRHFQMKRRKRRLAAIFISGIVVVTAALLLNLKTGNELVPQVAEEPTEAQAQDINQKSDLKSQTQTVYTGRTSNESVPNDIESHEEIKKGALTEKSVRTSTEINKSKTDSKTKPVQNQNRVDKSSLAIQQKKEKPDSPTLNKSSDNKIVKSDSKVEVDGEGKSTLNKPITPALVLNNPERRKSGNPAMIKLLHASSARLSGAKSTQLSLQEKDPVLRPVDPKIKQGSGFAISVYSNISSITKTLSADENSEYVERRQNEEKSMISPSYGASLIYSLNNFALSVGAEYSSVGEKTSYDAFSKQNQYVYTSEWQTFYRHSIDTDTAYISGLQWFLQYEITSLDSAYYTYTDSVQIVRPDPTIAERNGKTKFTTVEIPVSFHFSIPFKRYSVGISAGIAPVWIVAEKGYYLKEDLSGVQSVANSKPLKHFFLNGRLSLDLMYSLNPRLNFLLAPSYKTNLAHISNSDQKVRQKYSATGLSAGFIYKFN